MSAGVEHHDVVVIGAGIAGSALATALARGGLDVLLLERSDTFADRVRGEAMMHWGVKEAQALGLQDALLAAGGQFVTRYVGYDEIRTPEAAEAAPLDLGAMVSGVPGVLDIGHPQHCQALLDAAVAAGATVRRGVQVDTVELNGAANVGFRENDQSVAARAKLVVGADGRASATREALGLALVPDRPRNLLCGMLVEGVEAWPSEVITSGTEGDLYFFVVPMAGARARLYGLWPLDQRERFSGEGGAERFLASFRLKCCPRAEEVAEARAAGPLITYLNNESLTAAPFVSGGVLIGDAAGWSDPIVGCGLASAYRDARLVSQVLLASGDWSPDAFGDYAAERNERHRRLRAISDERTALTCDFSDEGRALRKRHSEASDQASYAALALAQFCGPESQPADVFSPEHRAYVLDRT